MSKAKPVKIWLNRAEGPVRECGERTVASFSEANWQLSLWARSAPASGGYDKCDFKVFYDNDDSYSGRFDLTRDDVGRSRMLEKHIQSMVDFYSGNGRPAHMDEQRYRNYLALDRVAEAAAQLADFGRHCQIGDAA